MNWAKIGEIVADAAPLVGTLLGGPAGAAVGGLVANIFGTKSEPDAVAAAIRNDPEAGVKLAALQNAHAETLQRMALEAETSRIAAVNATMRVEARSRNWWVSSWRPFWGYISALAFLAVALMVMIVLFQILSSGNWGALGYIPQIVGSIAALFGIPAAIVGVSAWTRGQEKIAKATGAPPAPGILGAIAKRIAGEGP